MSAKNAAKAGSVHLIGPNRPTTVLAHKNTSCCFARLLILCDGIYRCPCGRKQSRLAADALRSAAPKSEPVSKPNAA